MTTRISAHGSDAGAVRRSPAQWRSLVDAFSRSSETRKQFCSRHGVAPSTFSWWQRRLRDVRLPAPVDAARAPGLFVELSGQPTGATPSMPPWDVELELGGGVVLRLRRTPC